MSVFLLLNTKKDMLKTKQLTVATDFHNMEKNTMEVNATSNCLALLLCSTDERTEYLLNIFLDKVLVNDFQFFLR